MATPVHCVEAGPWELEQLGAAFSAHPELRPWFLPGPAEEHLGELAEARVLSPFIYSNVDAAALERMPALELIATRSTGFDHVDLDTCTDMRELLAQSHVVSLHAPATPETFHMIDADALNQMRPEAVLVNTARGGLIDTEALIAALDAGRLSGVGLDVFEGEHVPQEDEQLLSEEEHVPTIRARLAGRENVILTPHNGFNSSDAVRRIADTTVANVRAYLRGEPRNVVGGASAGRP